MTIIVMGHIKTVPGDLAKMTELLAAHVEKVRAEEGCELYAFAVDVADPDLLHISERWASVEALGAHGEAPHQTAFGRARGDFGIVDFSVKAWDGTFWRTLRGE